MIVSKSNSWSTRQLPRLCAVASLFFSAFAVAGNYSPVVSFADRPYTVGWDGDEPPAPPSAIFARTERRHAWLGSGQIGLFDSRERFSPFTKRNPEDQHRPVLTQPSSKEETLAALTQTHPATEALDLALGSPLSTEETAVGEDDSVLDDSDSLPGADGSSVIGTPRSVRPDKWTSDGCLPEDVCVLTCCDRCCILWTAWADALWLRRSSPDSRDLVVDDEAGPTPTNPARLNAENLDFDYAPGFRLGLLHYLNDCHSIGIGYFGIDGWNESATVFPPPSPLFVQYPGASVPIPGAVTFANGTDLYSAEINFRRRMTGWLAFLAGFRWVELNDQLLTSSSVLGPLYSIDTNNHLYGPQIGLDAILWDEGGFLRVDGWLKAGVMYNRADQRTNEFVFGPATVADRDDHAAFLGDLGVATLIRLTGSCGLRLGYQLLWLDGVALAPDQIAPTDITVPVAVLDTSGGLFFDGGFVGLELSW